MYWWARCARSFKRFPDHHQHRQWIAPYYAAPPPPPLPFHTDHRAFWAFKPFKQHTSRQIVCLFSGHFSFSQGTLFIESIRYIFRFRFSFCFVICCSVVIYLYIFSFASFVLSSSFWIFSSIVLCVRVDICLFVVLFLWIFFFSFLFIKNRLQSFLGYKRKMCDIYPSSKNKWKTRKKEPKSFTHPKFFSSLVQYYCRRHRRRVIWFKNKFNKMKN